MSFPSIYSYANYRLYLQDFYDASKAADSNFSFRQFARVCEVKSGNYLKLVIDGQRSLTLDNIQRFARGLELTGHGLDKPSFI